MKPIFKLLILSFLCGFFTQANAMNITIQPTNLTCGTTTVTGIADCSFSGTMDVIFEGSPAGLTITNISPVEAGSFTFDVTVSTIAPLNNTLKFTLLTGGTAGAGCASQGDISISNIVTSCGCSLDIEVTTTDESCFGCNDGTGNINVAGGSGSITYLWNTGQTASFENNLAPGNYIVLITDANGCQFTSVFTIKPFECIPFDVFETVSDASCYGSCDGSINLENLTNGSTDFTVNWNDGSTDRIREGLCSGTYNVMIKDDFNCIESFTYVIDQPQKIDINIISITNSNAAHKGEVQVQATGSFSPFIYTLIDNGNIVQTSTSGIFTSLDPGCYIVFATDIKGCTEGLDSICIIEETLSSKSIISDNINIFPNPASDLINLTIDPALDIQEITLRNSSGKIILKSAKITGLNVTDLPSGIYYITFTGKSIFKTYPINILH